LFKIPAEKIGLLVAGVCGFIKNVLNSRTRRLSRVFAEKSDIDVMLPRQKLANGAELRWISLVKECDLLLHVRCFVLIKAPVLIANTYLSNCNPVMPVFN
jgi:hypothetical protein